MYDSEMLDAIMGFFAAYMIVVIAFVVLMIVANWKIFTKAGQEGWKSIIPFYNLYTELKIVGMNPWLFLVAFIPFVGGLIFAIVNIIASVKLSKVFGHEIGFALGLIFLTPIFRLILAFGSSEYVGPQE